MSERRFIQHGVENEKLKEENNNKNENKKLEEENKNKNKNGNKNKQFEKNKIIKVEPKDLNWFDKNEFKEILAIIGNNKFSHRNKIGEFKYDKIKDLVNNIRNNTISEIDAKKLLNTLKKIKNAEIKDKRLIPGQRKLLNLFDNLFDIILTDNPLESESQENKNENKDEDYENRYENKDENKDEYKYDNKTISQDKKDEIIKGLKDNLDEITDKSKSFEDQIESLKKLEDLKEYLFMKDFDDKELKIKYFKIHLADMSNKIDEKLFETIFGHKLKKLVDNLTNATNKEKNQIIVHNIRKKKINF